MAGLTTTGITIKDVDEIIADMVASQVANIDANLNTEADSILGQLNGIYAAALAELWELVEGVYQSAYPDTASGQSLSYVSALTGAIRQEATKSEITALFVGTVDTVIPAGTRCYPDGDPDSMYETTGTVVIAEQGAIDFIGSPALALVEGTATTAAVGDTLILTAPISGVDSVAVAVYVKGVDEETDSALRYRREQSLALAGSSTVAAIRSDMLTVTGVDTCTVFENPTGDTDGNDVPPYAIEVLVYSSGAPSYTTAAVSAQIFASKPAGTETYGTRGPYTVTDSQGNSHSIKYSEPTTKRTYVEVALTEATDGTYVGDQAVQDAIEAWALNLLVGQSVYGSDIVNVVADLAGVVSVDLSQIGVDSSTPTGGDVLTVTARELATIDEADVTVL